MSTSRRDTSLRADARALYRLAALEDAQAPAAPPEPAQPSPTERARVLYEDTPVPVRAIASLCGVTERTIYKHARNGQWRRRYRTPSRGAGGRFIPARQAGRPHPRGLKATDPAGAARAVAACGRALELAAAAIERARRTRDDRADAYAIGHLARTLRELIRLGRQPGGTAGAGGKAHGKMAARRKAAARGNAAVRGKAAVGDKTARGMADASLAPPPSDLFRPAWVAPDGTPPRPDRAPPPVIAPEPAAVVPPAAAPPADLPLDPEVERRVNAIAEKYYAANEKERGPRIRRW